MAETILEEPKTQPPTLGGLVKHHVEIQQEYNRIRDRTELREKQIERLNNKLKKLPFWKDSLIKPIAEELIKHMPDRCYEILGPFGLSCETPNHIYRIGVDDKHKFEGDNCISITFRPGDLDKGELRIVDHEKNTGHYAKGTLGEVNGLNHPDTPLSPETTVEELLRMVK